MADAPAGMPVPAVEIYRLTLKGAEAASASQSVDLVVSRELGNVAGYLISGESSVTLKSLTVVGDTLRASVPTDHGGAELILEGRAGVFRGTLTVKGKALTVFGERIL